MSNDRRLLPSRRAASIQGPVRNALPPITNGLVWCPDLLSPDTVISGGVATLGDISGNSRHFIAPAAKPTFTASDANFGNKPSMTFDGLTTYLTLAAGFPASSVATLYAVVQGLSGGAVFGRIVAAGSLITDAGATGILLEGLDTLPAYVYRNPAGSNSERSVTVTAASITRLCGVGNLAAGGALWTTYKDGAASGTNIASLATAGAALSTQAAAIGATSVGGMFAGFTAPRIPFLLYNTMHTAGEVAAVDAWLAARNGI